VTEVFAAFGEKAVRAETVARNVLQEARAWIASGAAVGEHLADQLMLPMALAGGGGFSTNVLSSHATTNAEVISRFLPVRFAFEQGPERYTCRLA
jgi:RNA 3'-terminal phosphate cyclase (ATP)